jgi:nitroreductase
MCLKDCPSGVIEIKAGKASVENDTCLKCGHCIAICPVNAVTIDDFDPSEIEDFDQGQPHLRDDDFLKVLKSRRSIRHYQKKSVEKEKIEKIIEAGRYTPTARNAQDVSYIVVENDLTFLENEGLKFFKRWARIGNFVGKFVKLPIDFKKLKLEEGFLFHGAPALILVVSKNHTNATLAAMSMELMAEAQGLGTLYVGLFTRAVKKNKKIRKHLGLKKGQAIVQCLAVGYSDVTYKRTAPKKKAQVSWLTS